MPRRTYRFPLALAAALLVQSLLHGWFIASHSATYDEPMLITAGLAYWRTGRDTQIFLHPPFAKRLVGLAALCAGARTDGVEEDFTGVRTLFETNRDHLDRILTFARATTALAALALTVAVSLAARRCWGDAAGMLAAGLMAVEPNLLAHGSLATTDAWFTLFVTLFAIGMIRLADPKPPAGSGTRLGLLAGLALASKFSAVGFLPAVALGVRLAQGRIRGARSVLWRLGRSAPRIAGVAALTVVAAYTVHVRVFEPGFGSGGFGSWWPVTLAGEMDQSFTRGLRWAAARAGADQPAYFHGRMWSGLIPAYFPVTLLIKVPLAVAWLALVALGFGRGIAGPGSTARRGLAYAAAVMLASVLPASLHLGLRHILPIVPLLVLVAASSLEAALPRRTLRVTLGVVGFLWAAGSAARCAPHFIAHFNELVGGPAGGWRWVADSSIDWGQDLPALRRWLEEHGVREIPLRYFGQADPSFYGIRTSAVGPGAPGWRGGLVAVSVSRLNGSVRYSLDEFRWARPLTPIATPGWSIHVYDVNRAGTGPREPATAPR